MSKRWPLALAVALSTPAAAQTVATSSGDDAVPTLHLFDARVGLALGDADVGNVSGFSAGFTSSLGYRIGDVSVRALFDYYGVGSSDDGMQRHARTTRVGGALRYSIRNNGYDGNFGADFWGELGAGWQHVAWLQGGILDRPDVELALGTDLTGRGDPDRHGRRRAMGYFMAVRALVAEAPADPTAMATCEGPCSQATAPTRTDVTIFFELGVHWGR
ncbi:MAG TPA: hypothetical protein VLX92_35335 [Kofleriaceae bacterium]|nr:hypothetical protein [Kofleriaceae bacterium]